MGPRHYDGLDYTYTDAHNLDTDRLLPRRPHHQGRLYGEWQLPDRPLGLRLELVYRGSHFDDSESDSARAMRCT